MTWPPAVGPLGAVIAIVVVILGILGMLGVLPFTPTVVFGLVTALAISRLC